MALGNLAVDPDTDEMTDVFEEAGFEGALIGNALLRGDARPHRASRLLVGHPASV